VRVRRGGERESALSLLRFHAVTLSRVLPARCLTSIPEGASVTRIERADVPAKRDFRAKQQIVRPQS